jgi:hypothetical protein
MSRRSSGTETGSGARERCVSRVVFDGVETRPEAGNTGTGNATPSEGVDMLSTVAAAVSDGASSSLFGSGLGPAAALSSRGKIMSLRVTRNPRINMHWSSGRS